MAEEIMNVWDENLEVEFDKIMNLVEKYNYISMDTEFPGIVNQGENIVGYNFIRANVDDMRLIQVGITLSDENGESPKPINTWQFNLKFNLEQENHSKPSIDLLKEAGIDFDQLNLQGIPDLKFAELLLSSGLVLNEETHWITFHGAFDFGYLIKLITNAKLPQTLDRFNANVKTFFPSVYDLKIIVSECPELKNGSLAKLGHDLDVKRSGIMHQAGSDALLTLQCFFKIKETYLKSGIPRKSANRIFGLNAEYQAYNTTSSGYNSNIDKQPQLQAAQQYQFYPQPSGNFYNFNMMNMEVPIQNYYMNQFDAPMMNAMLSAPAAPGGLMNMQQSPYKMNNK